MNNKIKGAASWEDRDFRDLLIGVGIVIVIVVGIVGGLSYVTAR